MNVNASHLLTIACNACNIAAVEIVLSTYQILPQEYEEPHLAQLFAKYVATPYTSDLPDLFKLMLALINNGQDLDDNEVELLQPEHKLEMLQAMQKRKM